MEIKFNTLKMLSVAFILGAFSLSFASCSKNDEDDNVIPELEAETVADLDGSQGPVFFSLSTGTAVEESATTWDIKFNNSNFSFGNGAEAQVMEGIFDNLVVAPSSAYSMEDLAGIGSVYTYSGPPNHIVTPTPGRILVIKTHDNKYAKIELISYYLGNPDTNSESFINLETRPDSRIYTFRYIIQPDGSTNLK
ncbi:HmuY family protein [Parapedobacter tibetensis]|uniref:HmuY family protein n=1 Tax=Parapedobacter tibetensis TaxID=2972951 RepID=UPI00214DD680|nr:HmuY family protein [Parapedobacter tibetensis]